MFSKLEQRSWIKIEVARGKNARECHYGLREACGDDALPYRTVARWVATFRAGRDSVQQHPGGGRPGVENRVIELIHLFPKMKEPLRGMRFRTRDAILQAIGRSIADINNEGTAAGILRLPHIWQRVQHAAGDYIEGL